VIDEITAAMAELEHTGIIERKHAGIIERTGEMRWAERSREWQPAYALTELGRALSDAGISRDDYQDRAS
jgi:hypothetical protein